MQVACTRYWSGDFSQNPWAIWERTRVGGVSSVNISMCIDPDYTGIGVLTSRGSAHGTSMHHHPMTTYSSVPEIVPIALNRSSAAFDVMRHRPTYQRVISTESQGELALLCMVTNSLRHGFANARDESRVLELTNGRVVLRSDLLKLVVSIEVHFPAELL